MIPANYHDFFLAVAGASGALVGLLFVAVSIASERAIGESATIAQQIRASTALTALVTPLVLSLVALIPNTDIGLAAAIIGAIGLLFVLATLRRILSLHEPARQRWASISVLIGFSVIMLIYIRFGISLVLTPHQLDGIDWISGAIIGSLSLGIGRAWELVGARQSSVARSLRDLIHGELPKEEKPGQ